MSIEAAFEQYKHRCSVEESCMHGGISGGPGYLGFGSCRHLNHADVRYGCAACPDSCPDFCLMDDEQLFEQFKILCESSCSYRDEYGVKLAEIRPKRESHQSLHDVWYNDEHRVLE